MRYSALLGTLVGLIFGIIFFYTVNSNTSIRTYQDVDFEALCTIQVEIHTEDYIHYKTVERYPVSVYKVQTSRHGIKTYHVYANNRDFTVDSSACL